MERSTIREDAFLATLAERDKEIAELKQAAKFDRHNSDDWKTMIDSNAEMEKTITELRAALQKQANAIKTLHSSQDSEIAILRKLNQQNQFAIKSLDSEKEMNATLTQELEVANQRNLELRAALNEAADEIVKIRTSYGEDIRAAVFYTTEYRAIAKDTK